MFTLTVTFDSTTHQIVLGFESLKTAKQALEAIPEKSSAPTTVVDDFGREASFRPSDVVSLVIGDVEEEWRQRNKISIIKLRAENNFNVLLNADPTLKFLVGGAGPRFGGP